MFCCFGVLCLRMAIAVSSVWMHRINRGEVAICCWSILTAASKALTVPTGFVDLAILILCLCLAAFCSSLVRTWSNLANALSSISAMVVSSCAYRVSLFAWMASNLAAAIALRFCWKGLLWLDLETRFAVTPLRAKFSVETRLVPLVRMSVWLRLKWSRFL